MKDLLVSLINPYDYFYIEKDLHQANARGVYQSPNGLYYVRDTHDIPWELCEITKYVGQKDTFTYQELCDRANAYSFGDEHMARIHAKAQLESIMKDELGKDYEITSESMQDFLDATEIANCPIFFDEYGDIKEELLNSYQQSTYNCLL